ncbi:hypothetical protein AB1Y20_011063 [Prymnesium parvum]|uniref:XPA C-terminal domain-containing protein n=1 Tax=Prymnesium parvum TaxID=97485 RepID=A0AB34INW1_PRYPA
MAELSRRGAAPPPPRGAPPPPPPREARGGGMCVECGEKEGQPRFLEAFGVAVCFDCQRAHRGEGGRYQLISKAKAKDEYLLSERQLNSVYGGLGCQKVPNPHHARGGEMSLYLRTQAEQLALQTWKSSEGLYEEMRRRADEREARREKARGRQLGVELPGRGRKRPAAESVAPAASARRPPLFTAERHEHAFLSDEEYDGDADLWTKRCECGFSVQYERI